MRGGGGIFCGLSWVWGRLVWTGLGVDCCHVMDGLSHSEGRGGRGGYFFVACLNLFTLILRRTIELGEGGRGQFGWGGSTGLLWASFGLIRLGLVWFWLAI